MGQARTLTQVSTRTEMKYTIAFWFVMLVSAAAGVQIAVWAWDLDPPYEYEGGEISPNPAQLGARMLVTWHVKFKRHGDLCPGSVTRTLFNGKTGKAVAIYDPTPSAVSPLKLGDSELPKTFLLPDDLNGADEIRYSAQICYRCNPLQYIFTNRLCVTTPSLNFRIKN